MSDVYDVDFEPVYEEFRTFQLDYRGDELRALVNDRFEAWLHLPDVCEILDKGNTTHTARLVEDDANLRKLGVGTGHSSWHITLEGLYDICDKSRGDTTHMWQFYEWVEVEALPLLVGPREPEMIVKSFQSLGLTDQDFDQLQKTTAQVLLNISQSYEERLERSQKELRQLVVGELATRHESLKGHFTEYFDETIDYTTNHLRTEAAEAAKYKERAEKLAEELEETRHALKNAQNVMMTMQTTHMDHSKKLNRDLLAATQELEELKEEHKKWRKRARKWGKKLYKHDPSATHNDHELHRLKLGKLEE